MCECINNHDILDIYIYIFLLLIIHKNTFMVVYTLTKYDLKKDQVGSLLITIYFRLNRNSALI